MIELTIWEHPVAKQPFPREVVMTVDDPARVGELVQKAQELGFEFCHELVGMYHFTHPNSRDTACIAVVPPWKA